MDPEVVLAMNRVKYKIQAREEGELGLPIPDLVSAIIGEEADSELLDLVTSIGKRIINQNMTIVWI